MGMRIVRGPRVSRPLRALAWGVRRSCWGRLCRGWTCLAGAGDVSTRGSPDSRLPRCWCGVRLVWAARRGLRGLRLQQLLRPLRLLRRLRPLAPPPSPISHHSPTHSHHSLSPSKPSIPLQLTLPRNPVVLSGDRHHNRPDFF